MIMQFLAGLVVGFIAAIVLVYVSFLKSFRVLGL